MAAPLLSRSELRKHKKALAEAEKREQQIREEEAEERLEKQMKREQAQERRSAAESLLGNQDTERTASVNGYEEKAYEKRRNSREKRKTQARSKWLTQAIIVVIILLAILAYAIFNL